MKKSKNIGRLVCFIWVLLTACSCSERTDKTKNTHAHQNTTEKLRPVYHFTPQKNWVNDPNGLIYLDGEYHLFFQHHPHSTQWGPMHWGHAVSTDLLHWQELPIALYPDKLGYIYSGSAVYDKDNTSGLGTEATPPLVAIFTYHDMDVFKADGDNYQYQGLAYSTDKGRTWKKYQNNPIIPNPGSKDFRDPKVFWHSDTQQWIALIAAKDHIKFYSSDNLIDWSYNSSFGSTHGMHGIGVWECPDLFELKLEGSDDTKWVLLQNINEENPNGGSGTQYFIGHFDGSTFTNDNPEDTVLWLDYGKDNFAGITWNNAKRRIFLGWMSNWQYANLVPTTTWRNGMTFPRELSLKNTSQGLRLISRPVNELGQLSQREELVWASPNATDTLSLPFNFNATKIEGQLAGQPLDDLKLTFFNESGEQTSIAYDATDKTFVIDRTESGIVDFSENFPVIQKAPRVSVSDTLSFQLLLDANSMEAFFDGGQTVMTSLYFPNSPYHLLRVENGQNICLDSIKVHELALKSSAPKPEEEL